MMATRRLFTKPSKGALLMAGATLAAALSAGAVAPASAATNQQAVVVRAAYLKTAARLGWNNLIMLVRKGTSMSVLQGGNRYWLHVRLPDGKIGFITANHYYVRTSNAGARPKVAPAPSSPARIASTPTAAVGTTPAAHFTVPPGVHLDPSITPLATTSASPQAKYRAVLQIAQSKLGTPYIWGHNEDRGQYGFDCSNYVEYVFHHALGYLFSTSSRTQFRSVGWPVPLSRIQPGDLLFFSDNTNPTGSAHVGIYIGNGQMIEEGGGLGKVGYLPINTGYWSHHLVAARRMF